MGSNEQALDLALIPHCHKSSGRTVIENEATSKDYMVGLEFLDFLSIDPHTRKKVVLE